MRKTENCLLWGVLEDWDFLKKKFFVYASYASCMYIVRKTKKLLLWGAKEDSEPIWGKIFFLFG